MAFAFDVLRPEDLLALHIEARNLRLDVSRPKRPRLVREKAGDPAYLIVSLQTQHIAEKAYFETAPIASPPFNPPPPPPPGVEPLDPPGSVPSRAAGPSRLVFKLPQTMAQIPYRVDAILDWSQLELVLAPAAMIAPGDVGSAPQIAPPGDLHTALELPYRLLMSPSAMKAPYRLRWVHARRPVTHAGRTELWHTRLASARVVTSGTPPRSTEVLQEADDGHQLPLRALWSPDFVADGPLPSHALDEVPFLSSMSARDRDQIVILTSGFGSYFVQADDGSRTPWVPQPVRATRLFLSVLGGWLSLRGAWSPLPSYEYFELLHKPIARVPPARPVSTESAKIVVKPTPVVPIPPVHIGRKVIASLDLGEWKHVASQGRDGYVRIVYEGYLYPFGHRASLVKVTERKVASPDGVERTAPVAYLRQRMYIVVRETEKSYTASPYQHQGREMPLSRRVRINTKVTPDINPPVYIGGGASFWVDVGGPNQGFEFHLSALDIGGHSIDFLAELIFVSLSEGDVTRVQAAYAAADDRRRCSARGQRIAYADPAAGDTVLKTNALYFDAQVTRATPPFPSAPFLPTLDRAAVTVPVLEQLLGTTTATMISLYEPYVASGLDSNAGVFAVVVSDAPTVTFSAHQAGGFATPNLSLTTLSARKGIVSGAPDDAAAGALDPAAYFGEIDAKLFGTVPLKNLIPIDQITGKADAAKNAPEIRLKYVPNRKHPTSIVTRLVWNPDLTDYENDPVKLTFNSDGQSSALKLTAFIERKLDGSPPTSHAHGVLSNFLVNLLGVVNIKVTSITFDAQNGQKTSVVAHLNPKQAIEFVGPLSFVQTLADILPPGLFGGSGPRLELTSTGIRVSITIALPTITCGVFSLEHIAITTALDLPFLDGKPAFEFAFAARSRPFLVTVEIFGGGGFVHVVLDTDGIQMVEGAIEFGGNYALDFGVGSGAVHVMAGIYFQLKGSSSDLTGFVDIGGEVSILGIISISIDINLSLSWQHSPQGDVIQGRATLTLSIRIFFFSVSVSLSVERSFQAGGGDPRVYQLISTDDWSGYAAAFA